MNEKKKLNEQQTEKVSGGKGYIAVTKKCERCGAAFRGLSIDKYCEKCVKETEIHTTENGAYGGW